MYYNFTNTYLKKCRVEGVCCRRVNPRNDVYFHSVGVKTSITCSILLLQKLYFGPTQRKMRRCHGIERLMHIVNNLVILIVKNIQYSKTCQCTQTHLKVSLRNDNNVGCKNTMYLPCRKVYSTNFKDKWKTKRQLHF